MKDIALIIAVILLLLVISLAATAAEDEPETNKPWLIPWPQRLVMGEGCVTVPADIAIAVSGDDLAAAGRVAETFKADLAEYGFAPVITKDAKGPKITLRIGNDRTLGDEGYRLKIDGGIEIVAAAERGLFWGTRTALQLLRNGPDAPVSNLSIWDKPEFWYRGLLVDTAREFHSIEFHKRMVKNIARYKINMYQIHFSDDQSYTLPSKAFPDLPTPDRHYTKEQLEDLVKLAEQYHVTIVPEIESPGHSWWMCARIPDFVCKGKSPSGMICGGSEKSIEAAQTLISEAMEIFPGPYFHIGVDEVYVPAWDNCSECQGRIQQEKLDDNEALYNYYINRLNRFVRSKGRQTIIWEGFKPGKEPIIDKNVLVMMFENRGTIAADVLNAGYDVINTSWSPIYVVKKDSSTPEAIAEWNALYFGRGRPPRTLDSMLKVEPTEQIKGIQMCCWENVEAAEEPMLFGVGEQVEGHAPPAPRLPAAAERAWSGSRTSAQDLLERLADM